MSNRFFSVIAASLAAAVLLLGCTATAPTPAAKPTTAPSNVETPVAKPTAAPAAQSPTLKPAVEQPRYGGTLTISASADPVSFDLHGETTLASLEPIVSAYDNLVQYDLRTGNIVGDLAERWEMSPDALVFTFYLHQGVKWHDGQPFSAEDVRYNLARQKDPPKGVKVARPEVLASVDRIETPDKNTVKIVMKEPYVAFMSAFATDWWAVMPKHILEAKGEMRKEVLGTGPFKLKSYSSGVSVELVKNPDYFMKGLPYLDGIKHYIIKDAATRFAAFRTGRVKMTGHWAALIASEVSLIKAEYPQLVTWRVPALQGPRYAMNCSRPPFNDVRVRRAVSLAYDRQSAIKVLAEGEARLGTFVPPGPPWGLPEEDIVKLPGYRQPKDADRAEAKKLLAEAGYPGGFKVMLMARSLRADLKAGEFLKDQLATIGIDATLDVVDSVVYSTRTGRQAGDFLIMSSLTNWKIDDPEELGRKFMTGAGTNHGIWSVKQFDELFLEQSRATDPAKRKAIVRQLDELLLQEWPDVWPYWMDAFLGTWPEVKNFAAPRGLSASMRNTDVWLAR